MKTKCLFSSSSSPSSASASILIDWNEKRIYEKHRSSSCVNSFSFFHDEFYSSILTHHWLSSLFIKRIVALRWPLSLSFTKCNPQITIRSNDNERKDSNFFRSFFFLSNCSQVDEFELNRITNMSVDSTKHWDEGKEHFLIFLFKQRSFLFLSTIKQLVWSYS